MANQGYPTAEQIRDRDRRNNALRMEEEAQLRGVYGTPEEREHERMRVSQEWDKIEHDKAQGMNDAELWGRHLRRMRRMATSLKCPKKAARRARHFELAGLSTAAKYFQQRSEFLGQQAKKAIDPQTDILIDNLNRFSDFVEKWESRRPGEIWTRRGGQRVIKRPDGVIVPYFGPKEGEDKKEEEEEKTPTGKAKKGKPEVGGAGKERRTLMSVISVRAGENGSLISPHFSKSEEALVRLVKAYLATQEKKSKYKKPEDLTDKQKANKEYMKYNKGIRQSEEMARTFGEKGLKEHEKDDTDSSLCRFLLASCLVFADIAGAMGRRRDGSE